MHFTIHNCTKKQKKNTKRNRFFVKAQWRPARGGKGEGRDRGRAVPEKDQMSEPKELLSPMVTSCVIDCLLTSITIVDIICYSCYSLTTAITLAIVNIISFFFSVFFLMLLFQTYLFEGWGSEAEKPHNVHRTHTKIESISSDCLFVQQLEVVTLVMNTTILP